MASPGGGMVLLGSGTPETGGGKPFHPVPAEFNHCSRRSLIVSL